MTQSTATFTFRSHHSFYILSGFRIPFKEIAFTIFVFPVYKASKPVLDVLIYKINFLRVSGSSRVLMCLFSCFQTQLQLAIFLSSEIQCFLILMQLPGVNFTNEFPMKPFGNPFHQWEPHSWTIPTQFFSLILFQFLSINSFCHQRWSRAGIALVIAIFS